MTAFAIIGWESSTLCSALMKFRALEKMTCSDTDRLCLEAGFADLDTMKAVAGGIPSSRFAVYGWAPIPDASFLKRPEMQSAQSLRLNFGDWQLLSQPNSVTDAYDWDGVSLSHSVQITRGHIESGDARDRRPDVDFAIKLRGMASGLTSRDALVTASTAYRDGCRDHTYTVHVPSKSALGFVRSVVEMLRLSQGVGSFEFLGRIDDIACLHNSGTYSLQNFPENCWSFNTPPGKTPFAIEAGSFLRPVLNVRAEQLQIAAAVIDDLRSKITRCYVTRKYVSWRFHSGRCSRCAQGNYVRILKDPSNYTVHVGYEQQSDEDPDLTEFTSAMSPAVAQFGGRLRRVHY